MRLQAVFLAPALIVQAQVAPVETPLSGAERAEALAVLAQAKAAFLKATEGLTPAQRAWQPGPDRWSVDQCAEHIAVTGTLISELITGKLLPGPRTPGQRSEIHQLDGKLMPMILDRSHKAKAPDAIAPTPSWRTPSAPAPPTGGPASRPTPSSAPWMPTSGPCLRPATPSGMWSRSKK